jgi:DNA mismatch repair protein MutS
VTARAEEVLKALEEGDKARRIDTLVDNLPLFRAAARHQPAPDVQPDRPGPSEADRLLTALNPDDLTPKQALEVLYELKGKARGCD